MGAHIVKGTRVLCGVEEWTVLVRDRELATCPDCIAIADLQGDVRRRRTKFYLLFLLVIALLGIVTYLGKIGGV